MEAQLLMMLSLFDETEIRGTRYLPPPDRLTMVAGDLSDAPGISYVPEFISPPEEQYLLARADEGRWSDHWTRHTQVFGFSYDRASEDKLTPAPAAPLPRWSEHICRRLFERGILPRSPNQMGINEYLPGQGIAQHVDHFGGSVVSLTLSAGCIMDITQPESKRRIALWLAPRSIIVLQGEARTRWEHGIGRRQKDIVGGHVIARERRVSITFRDVIG
jgi:alkylated DNA repair dioxygenase AlkB